MTNKEITLFVLWCWLKETARRARVRARSARRAVDPVQRAVLDAARAAHASRPENKNRHAIKNAEWWDANPEKGAQYQRVYAARYPERIKQAWQKWFGSHKGYTARRAREIPHVRVARNCRKRIWDAVRGFTKATRTENLIGCSSEELMRYLETRFQSGMTWENYGPVWHIDHIKPCAKFDLSDPAQQRACFHYTNLQPLWAIDNLRKGAR